MWPLSLAVGFLILAHLAPIFWLGNTSQQRGLATLSSPATSLLALLALVSISFLQTAAASEDPLLQGLSVAGIRPVVPDHLFIHDPDSAVFKSPDLKPHEHQFPPPFGELSARLQAYVDAGIKRPPLPATGAPATLHITHSWGGGIARWINVFIQADKILSPLQQGVHCRLTI